MKSKGFWGNFRAAVSDFAVYRQFVVLNTEAVVWYFFLLLLLITVTGTLSSGILFRRHYFHYSELIKQNLPRMELRNGELSLKADQPYRLLKLQDFEVVIDTTGKTETIENGVLIQKSRILMVDKKSGRIEEQDFTRLKGLAPLVIDREFLSGVDRVLTGPLMWIVIFFAVFFTQLFLLLLFLLVFSLVFLSYSQNLKQKLSYARLWSVGIFALSGPTLLAILYKFLVVALSVELPLGVFFLIYSGVYLFYLLNGLKAAGGEGETELTA